MGNKNWERIPEIEQQLKNGEVVSKKAAAEKYGISEKGVQRDVEKIKEKYAHDPNTEIIYSRSMGGYVMNVKNPSNATNSEILAVCKIVLESRAFNEPDMKSVLNKMVKSCTAEGNYKSIMQAIANEMEHYRGPYHGKSFIELLWDISKAIRGQKFVNMKYENEDSIERIKPAGLMFSEHYFYLLVYMDNGSKNYRVDKIEKFDVMNESFHVNHVDRFEEGEYRKHIHNMVGGKSRILKFWFKAESVEEVMDMFPEARIIEENYGRWLIRAEVFGDGADFWFKGHGDKIEIVEDTKMEDDKMTDFYNDGGSSEVTLKIEMFKKDDLIDPNLDGRAITWSLTGSNGGTYENAYKTTFDHINITISPKQLGEAKNIDEVIDLLKTGVKAKYGDKGDVCIFDKNAKVVAAEPDVFKNEAEFIDNLVELGDYDLIDYIVISSEAGDTMIRRNEMYNAEHSYTQEYKYEKRTQKYKARVLGNESKKGNGVGGGLYFDDIDLCKFVTWQDWNDTTDGYVGDEGSNAFMCEIEITLKNSYEVKDRVTGETRLAQHTIGWQREGWHGNWGEELVGSITDHIIVKISPKQLGQAKSIAEMKELLIKNVYLSYGMRGRGLHCFDENDPIIKELVQEEYNRFGEDAHSMNSFMEDIRFIKDLESMNSIDEIQSIRITGDDEEIILRNDLVDASVNYTESYEYFPETGEYKCVIKGSEKGRGYGGGLYFDDLDECETERYDSVYGGSKDERSRQEIYLSWSEDYLNSFERMFDEEGGIDISEEKQKASIEKLEQIKALLNDIRDICGFPVPKENDPKK